MSTPSFIQFRTGIPVSLPEGKPLTYAEFNRVGLQDFYLRIIYHLATEGKLTRTQLDSWLRTLSAKDAAGGRRIRAELEALRPAYPSLTGSSATAKSRGTVNKRARPEKIVLLVSRGDHKQALRTAQSYGLHPVAVAPQALKPGQSPEAHTVQASEGIASKLITTGNWKTAE